MSQTAKKTMRSTLGNRKKTPNPFGFPDGRERLGCLRGGSVSRRREMSAERFLHKNRRLATGIGLSGCDRQPSTAYSVAQQQLKSDWECFSVTQYGSSVLKQFKTCIEKKFRHCLSASRIPRCRIFNSKPASSQQFRIRTNAQRMGLRGCQ